MMDLPSRPVAFGCKPCGGIHVIYLFGDDGTLYIVTPEHRIEELEDLQTVREASGVLAPFINDYVLAFELASERVLYRADSYKAWLSRICFNW